MLALRVGCPWLKSHAPAHSADISARYEFQFCNIYKWTYSRTPLIRPPSESHWCGRIRGMVAREGFRYGALLQQRHMKYGRIRGMVVGEGGRSTGVLLYHELCETIICPLSYSDSE